MISHHFCHGIVHFAVTIAISFPMFKVKTMSPSQILAVWLSHQKMGSTFLKFIKVNNILISVCESHFHQWHSHLLHL